MKTDDTERPVPPADGPSAACTEHRHAPLRVTAAFGLGDLRAALLLVLAVTALGVPVGLLWAALAPRASIVVTANGAVFADHRQEAFVGADGAFAGLVLVAGLVVGVGTYLWRRRRGPWMAIGLAAGSLAGAYVAWKVGHQVGLAEYRRVLAGPPSSTRFDRPVELRAQGMLFLQPLVAVIVYVLAAGWSRFGDLGRLDAEPPQWADVSSDSGVSSGSAAPAAPPAAPVPPPAGGASSPPA
jgi:hypothetical protein